MSTSITVVCYKSKTLSNGEHPLMLRICQDRKTKYQSLGVSIAEKHWDFEKNSPKSKCPNRDILIKLILKVQMWKSHATLTLLATQDCPLWLQYD